MEEKYRVDAAAQLSELSYTTSTRASQAESYLSPVSPTDEWFEIGLTADSSACDTVIPKDMCPGIPARPSLQSIRGMEYEVANGESIPNLGERRCLMWTEGALAALGISMQVADVHKALLSFRCCADMKFESRFGRVAGSLTDTNSGEVIPLTRKGHLYVLRAWIRSAAHVPWQERWRAERLRPQHP